MRASRRRKPFDVIPANAGTHPSTAPSLPSNRNTLPIEERFVPRSNGPDFRQGDERMSGGEFLHRSFVGATEMAVGAVRLICATKPRLL